MIKAAIIEYQLNSEGQMDEEQAVVNVPPVVWEDQAAGAIDAIQKVIAPRLRQATDDAYAALLYSVQDYLLENVLYNVSSDIEAARRQATHDRERAIKAEGEAAALLAALKAARAELENIAEHPGPNADDAAHWRADAACDALHAIEPVIAKAEGRQ